MMANWTLTFCSGWAHPLVKVAVTVAVVPTPCVWVGGVRLRTEPLQGVDPITVHWIDSFLMIPSFGQSAASMPPVFRTWPESVWVVVCPLMVTSTVGCRPSGVQTSPCEVPLGPTSEVSMKAFAGQPVATPPVVSWVTISSDPDVRVAGPQPL